MLKDHPLTQKLIQTAKSRFPGLVKAVKQAQSQLVGQCRISLRRRIVASADSRHPNNDPSVDVKSLLDIPCGDYRWMKEMALPVEHYVGADIVSDIITLNASKYGGPGKTFIICDLTKDRLPRADCVLCRDCLDHLSIRHIFKALRNIQLSGSTYLITTLYADRTTNGDIHQVTGGRPT